MENWGGGGGGGAVDINCAAAFTGKTHVIFLLCTSARCAHEI